MEGAEDLLVAADPTHVTAVLDNLVTNALRYAGPPVVIGLDGVVDGQAQVTVSDAGPGIPHRVRARLFTRFAAGDKVVGGAPSSGLGLWIVRSLVTGYGGTVRHRNLDPQGSEFEIRLPMADGVPGPVTRSTSSWQRSAAAP